jgi:hypothetical protein
VSWRQVEVCGIEKRPNFLLKSVKYLFKKVLLNLLQMERLLISDAIFSSSVGVRLHDI